MANDPIDIESWQKISQRFDQLCELEPGQRRLDQGDLSAPEQALLEQMLTAHDAPDPQVLDQTLSAVAEHFGDIVPETGEDCTGRRFGPWRAVGEIGRGGMGLVLKAERDDGQFDKQVAIKLLRTPGRGLAHERLLEEIRILARLEHPNIARLIDGGVDERGQPYLVMEYVEGQAITDHCRNIGLAISARVELMIQVLGAVEYAHRHLVVHCDIKPANVLVSEEGQVKLVDFGIAALARTDSPHSAAKRGVFCSPGYCAPEQLRGQAPATSQDIFALGALLFELLAGRRLRDNATATRLLFGRLAEHAVPDLSGLSATSGLDGDLLAICARALAEDPAERYSGAGAMRADLVAWQQSLPVSARPATRRYLLGKWLSRNRWPAAAAGVAVAALLLGATISVWQAHQARQAQLAAEKELARSTELHQFVLELFEGARLGQPRAEVPDTRELLLSGAERARSRFQDQPELQGDLLAVIGTLLRNVGLTAEGRELLDEALVLMGDSQNWQNPRYLDTVYNHALALHYTGRPAEAAERLQRLVDHHRQRHDHPALVRTLHAWGFALSEKLEYDRALEAHREALELQQTRLPEDELAVAEGQLALARTQLRAGQLEPSADTYEQALTRLRDIDASPSLTLAMGLSDYGVTLRRLHRYQQAEQILREALVVSADLFSGPHTLQAQTWNNLGAVLVSTGDRVGAVEAFEQAVAILTAMGTDGPPQVLAGPLNNLGFLSLSIGQTARAEEYLRDALARLDQTLGPASAPHIAVSHNLGRCLLAQERYDEAWQVLLAARAHAVAAFEPADTRLLGIDSALARIRWARDSDPEAVPELEAIYRLSLDANGAEHPDTARHALALAEVLSDMARFEPAEPLFASTLAVSEQHLSALHPQSLDARLGLAELALKQGDKQRARDLLAAWPAGPELAASDPLTIRRERLEREAMANALD